MLIRDYTDLLDSDYPESVLISSDWLEEQGHYQESLALKSGQLLPETLFSLHGFGYAHVYGYDHGLGNGYSSGYSIGFGYGYGDGRWNGYGTNIALLSSNYLALSSHANS